MPTYGLTTEGFLAKTLTVLRDEIGTAIRQVFGASVRLDDESILGQLVGIVAERLASLWELTEIINSSMDADAATGAALERLCLFTGTIRPGASYSAVVLTLTGTAGTSVTASSRVRTASTSLDFQTGTTAVLAAVPAWIAAHAYTAGERFTANGSVYQVKTGGTSDALAPTAVPPLFLNLASSPQAQDAIADNTAVLIYLGPGTAAVDVAGWAVDTGPISGTALDISVVVNPITGWDGVTNVVNATLGRDIAADPELRILREQELATGGSSPINALRAELLRLADVIAVTIFQNITDVTDVDGVPPHSIEALVRGPVSPSADFDQSVFDALLAGVAAGIRTHGSVVGAAADDEGTSHVMKFTRPTEVPIYISIFVEKDPDEYPADGDDQIKAAIVAWGEQQNTGKNAVASRISSAAFDVPGVLDITACWIDDAPAPTTSATVAISLRQLATYAISRITVTSVDGVP